MGKFAWLSGWPRRGPEDEGARTRGVPTSKPCGARPDLAAEVLEECPDGRGVAPGGQAGGGAVPREAAERVGRRMGQQADEPSQGKPRADGVDARDLDVNALDSPSADATVRILGTMGRSGRTGLTTGVMLVRTFHRLGRPAKEGAGQDEAGQEDGEDGSHGQRSGKGNRCPNSNSRANARQVKRAFGILGLTPGKTARLINLIG